MPIFVVEFRTFRKAKKKIQRGKPLQETTTSIDSIFHGKKQTGQICRYGNLRQRVSVLLRDIETGRFPVKGKMGFLFPEQSPHRTGIGVRQRGIYDRHGTQISREELHRD